MNARKAKTLTITETCKKPFQQEFPNIHLNIRDHAQPSKKHNRLTEKMDIREDMLMAYIFHYYHMDLHPQDYAR